MRKFKVIAFAAAVAASLAACDDIEEVTDDDVLSFFSSYRHGSSIDYGLFSSGHLVNGQYLMGVFSGAVDNLAVCEDIAEKFNRDASGSVSYRCLAIN